MIFDLDIVLSYNNLVLYIFAKLDILSSPVCAIIVKQQKLFCVLAGILGLSIQQEEILKT